MLISRAATAATPNTALRTHTKFLWGLAGLGIEALRQSRTAWLVYFYAPPSDAGEAARLSLVTVSVLLFGGKLIEAFADTLVGYWSDRTSSRLGRRLPFILLASPPMALFAVLLFAPPARLHGASVALYFFIALELFFLCNSLVSVPYEALMPEIALTSQERVSLSGWRVVFGVVGAGIGLISSGLLISAFGYWVMALVMALLSLGGRYVGVAAVWKRARRDTPPAPLAFRTTLRFTLDNRPFLVFLFSSVLFSTALAMLVGLLPYFVSSVLRKDDTGTWASILTAVGIGAMTLALPFFARLARRTSNQQAYLVAMLASAVAFPVLFFAGLVPGISLEAQALLALVIVGAPLAGVYLFPGPIIADLCDEEASVLGVRREGMFFSAQSFMDKITEAFAPLLLGLILLLGNSREHLLGIRLVGPIAGLVVFSGYLLFRVSYHSNTNGFRAETPTACHPEPQ